MIVAVRALRRAHAPASSCLSSFRNSGRDVVARQRIGDVGGEEADLRAAIEDAAVEAVAEERLGVGKGAHRVGDLDLAAGAGGLDRQQCKDLRLQDVAAGDHEVRGRVRRRRLLDHRGDAKAFSARLADADDAVLRHLLARHFGDRDHVAAVGLGVHLHHPGEAAARRRMMKHVGEQQRERLVADEFARAPHRVAESERLLLAREAGLPGARKVSTRASRAPRSCRASATSPRARTACRNGPRSRPCCVR